ncbi:glycosyltransferase family 4 protein [uncultured Pontibacter sp.]|uniref:glycosyltransferase family 4 protein n=1 Tax=uncultured Pontibacter sp. TaxID=453356 RepID=UPI00342D5A1B
MPAITHEGISKQVLLQINSLLSKEYSIKLIVLTKADKAILVAFAPLLPSEDVVELKQEDPYLSVRALRLSLPVALKVRKHIRSKGPLVIFAHAPLAHFIMRLVMLLGFRGNNCKLWQYFHITQYAEHPLNSWKRKLINILNKRLANLFDYGHIFVSEAVKNDIQLHLIKLNNNRVIYNALDSVENIELNTKHTRESERKLQGTQVFTILLPGRIEASKGQLWFLDPLQKWIRLKQLKPEQVQVLVVGEGSQKDRLSELVLTNGLLPYVTITGLLPNKKVLKYMRQCDLVVIPSFVEGLPLVILEALQQRAIVLASDIKPNQEVISRQEIGHLFKTGDVADCIDKLQFLFQHRGQELVNSRAIETLLKTRFSFEVHMQRLINVIEDSTSNG